MPFFIFIGAESLSIGEKWGTSGITTLIGLGMTFVILALLIGTILLMRPVLNGAAMLSLKMKNAWKKVKEKLFSKNKKSSQQVVPPDPIETTAEASVEKELDAATINAIEQAVMHYVKTDDNVVVIKSISRADKAAEVAPVQTTDTATQAAPAPAPVASGKGKPILAPMPGTVLKYKVSSGATVKEGEVVFILEAMKMENDIVSPASGVFKTIVAEGTKVNTGDLIAEIQ